MRSRFPSRGSPLAARLAAQRLAGPPATDVVDATRHLLAIQAQDPQGARLALRARSTSNTATDTDHALTHERSLIISWLNRGTLHLIAVEDEPLLHLLTTPQLRRTSDRRLHQEGVTPATARRGINAITNALGHHGPMTRGQIRAVLQQARVPVAGQAMVHILFRASLDGLIIRGPIVGGEHAFALAVDWLGERPKLDRNTALGELAHRYLLTHGPATDRDLAKWAGLSLRDARAGLQTIARRLDPRPDGRLDVRARQPAPLPAPRLLGPFDPILLGWCSRELILGDAENLVVGNGTIKAIVLIDGRAGGTWTMRNRCVDLQLWSEQPHATMAALDREASAIDTYLAPA